jgi:hypothetical protein
MIQEEGGGVRRGHPSRGVFWRKREREEERIRFGG